MATPFTWVYLIHDPYTGFFKIGQSDNPESRLRELNRKPSTIMPTPNDFTIYEAWFCPASKEREYHKIFHESRKRGEWFALDGDDVEYIEYDLYRYNRWKVEDNVPLVIQQLCERQGELIASNYFYANGIRMFFECVGLKNGQVNPILLTKQLTTRLPNEEYFLERV